MLYRNPFARPIVVSEKITENTHLRLDLVGSFDVAERWRNDLWPMHATAALAVKLNGKGGKVIISPARKTNSIDIIAHYYNGETQKVTFDISKGLDITDSAWTFLLAPLAVLNIQGGCRIEVFSYWPPKSGLGGSGALKAALIKAFLLQRHKQLQEPYPTPLYITHIAHSIDHVYTEDWDSQDVMMSQNSSGIAMWLSDGRYILKSFSNELLQYILPRIVLGYTHEQHHAGTEGSGRTAKIHKADDAEGWIQFARIGNELITCLEKEDKENLISIINKFTDQKIRLSPQYISEKHDVLRKLAIRYKAAFKPMGAGKGGCCIAIAPSIEVKEKIREEWIKEGIEVFEVTVANREDSFAEEQYYCMFCGSFGITPDNKVCSFCGKKNSF